ncbi:hypothetical protein C2E23DRAFT_859644 [Lenzites betulinus]|nr:hypothetical protein C2E23DRAFT_859644 [Lenzites betulinus]
MAKLTSTRNPLTFTGPAIALMPILEPKPEKPPKTFAAILNWTEDTGILSGDAGYSPDVTRGGITGRSTNAGPEELIRIYCNPPKHPLFSDSTICHCAECNPPPQADITRWDPLQTSIPLTTGTDLYSRKMRPSGDEAWSTGRWIPSGIERTIWTNFDGRSKPSTHTWGGQEGRPAKAALLFPGLFYDYSQPPHYVAPAPAEYYREHAVRASQVDQVCFAQVLAVGRPDATGPRVGGRLDDWQIRLLREIWERP